jgi:hypothetical protein
LLSQEKYDWTSRAIVVNVMYTLLGTICGVFC